MTSKSRAVEAELDLDTEPRDYTKWVWLGVIALFVAMGVVLYLYSGLNPQVSQVRVRHILVAFNASDPAQRGQALTRIRDIRERVLKGEDFGKLARDNSNDPGSASRGGDLGYVKKGELDAAFDAYIWRAPIGQLSDIIQTQHGFHIIVVDERRLSEADAFEERRRQQAATPAPATAVPSAPTANAPAPTPAQAPQ
jgi:parvulin-like peptidyl-prolyl isomerase